MESCATTTSRKIGRPRSFDRTKALKAAMLAFWRNGYETTSIVDLTTAMGITAPSLYAAFGDKKQLFLEAMRLYAGDPAELGRTLDAARSAVEAIADLWRRSADAFTDSETPRGCLVASAAASGSSTATDVQQAIAQVRREIVTLVAARIARDVADGRLPGDVDAKALAGMTAALIQGLSVLARDGVSRDDLHSIVAAATAGLPQSA